MSQGFPEQLPAELSPDEALHFVLAFLESGPSDDMLCAAALTIGEPLVDWHWEALLPALEELLATRADFRKMVSCCDFDLPDGVGERLHSYVKPEDDIGRSPGV